jgi:hypothetical protein
MEAEACQEDPGEHKVGFNNALQDIKKQHLVMTLQ